MSDSENVIVVAVLIAVFIGLVFLFSIAGALIGAFVGWVISITPVLGVLVEGGFEVFGVQAKGMLTHIGAMLGFVSGFIRGVVEVKKEKD